MGIQSAGIGIALLVLATGCGNKNQQGGQTGAAAGQANAVKEYAVVVMAPRRATLNSDFPASIQGQQNVEIRPKIDGYIENIYVDEGAAVKKGQLLFRISAPQYAENVRTAAANIQIAQADVNAAEMNVNKVRPLVEKDIISKYELQSAQFALQSRQAALAQARANLANARTNLSYTTIYSPADGVIGTIPYKIGSLVSSTIADPLTTVSNIGNIYAYFAVNEKQALNFSASAKGATQQAKLTTLPPVTLILSNGIEYPHKGRIDASSGLINTQTGSVNVRATFPNPAALIRSGSSATVRLPFTIDTALLVPQKATFEIQGKMFVYVAGADSLARSVEIQVNPNTENQCYVVQQGLRPGTRIIIEGVQTLREGAPLRPRPVNADSVYNSLAQQP
ncbi:MAG: efflux RND transporter periplasmic adaptor subunit [Williamsia sp.]|nr:efflux RND transporter periplasmic adaptor subunit [Williamsia sp.]